MKRTLYLIVMIFSAMLIITACGSNNSNNDVNTSPVVETPVAETPDAETPAVETPVEDTNNPLPSDSGDEIQGSQLAGSIMTVDQLESGLAIGATQEDVNILFDSHPYKEVSASMDGGIVWRYDFGAQADYSYEEELDLHDEAGILNGEVPLQVFIYYDDEGKVSAYIAYQAGEEGKITVYQTLSDGSREVNTI